MVWLRGVNWSADLDQVAHQNFYNSKYDHWGNYSKTANITIDQSSEPASGKVKIYDVPPWPENPVPVGTNSAHR